MKKSNLDVAFELVSKKKNPVEFAKLWEEVSSIQGLTSEEASKRVGKFYTQLSLDGRFVTLGENTWDLRERHEFDKVHISMNDVYADIEEENIKEINENASEKELFGDEDDFDQTDDENEDDEDSSYDMD